MYAYPYAPQTCIVSKQLTVILRPGSAIVLAFVLVRRYKILRGTFSLWVLQTRGRKVRTFRPSCRWIMHTVR